jgi:hypothetical protein
MSKYLSHFESPQFWSVFDSSEQKKMSTLPAKAASLIAAYFTQNACLCKVNLCRLRGHCFNLVEMFGFRSLCR